MSLKKIDTIIIVILIVISGLFLYKAGYILPSPPTEENSHPETPVNTLPPEPTPPTSFTPAYRRDVSPDDEGVHFDKLRICREWWSYSVLFTEKDSDLNGWSLIVSFNHMARGDLLGTTKPDVLVVSLLSPDGETYGGIINKERGLGLFHSSTLTAGSPGVQVKFENSWAEGRYPFWHIHAEGADIDGTNDLIVDLDYHAPSLALWTIGNRAFDKSDSTIACYTFIGCEVSGNITLDAHRHQVKGTGTHEHSWTPNGITKATINGWDWFTITLDNGWNLYSSSFYPTPEIVSSITSRINPIATVVLTTDQGKTLTELKNVDLKITEKEERVFPGVKLPAAFTLTAQPSLNPLYIVSQSLLYGTKLDLTADITMQNVYSKIWKFPTYVGTKIGLCNISGSLSWSDSDGDHAISFTGFGLSWSMRALF